MPWFLKSLLGTKFGGCRRSRLTAGRAQIDDLKNTTALEEYWDKHKLTPSDKEAQPSVEVNGRQTNGYRKSRSMSTATTFIPPHHSLMPHHPAITLLDALKDFGPLIFPLYRASLLRKRILIVTDTPVESSCNFGAHPPCGARTGG